MINTYATYKSGLESDGLYITDSTIGMQQANKVDVFGSDLILLGIGFLLFSIIALFLIYYKEQDKEIGFLYFAIATIFMTIYFSDYLKIVYLPHNHLVYKKIFMISISSYLVLHASSE